VEKTLALLSAHLGVGIAKDKPNSCEEVTLSGSIATNDYVCFWRKWFDDGLVLVAAEIWSAVATG
jgi:hypothetical protein